MRKQRNTTVQWSFTLTLAKFRSKVPLCKMYKAPPRKRKSWSVSVRRHGVRNSKVWRAMSSWFTVASCTATTSTRKRWSSSLWKLSEQLPRPQPRKESASKLSRCITIGQWTNQKMPERAHRQTNRTSRRSWIRTKSRSLLYRNWLRSNARLYVPLLVLIRTRMWTFGWLWGTS